MLNLLILAAVFGFVAFLVAPLALAKTKYGSRLGNSWISFALMAIKRPGIGVTKNGELLLRQLSPDDVYNQETTDIGGVEKKIIRTAQNVHRFGKTPLAFFDAQFGITFDLKDLLLGRLAYRHADNGDMVVTDEAFADGELVSRQHYVRAFFEVQGREALDMNLDTSIRPIIDGAEDASMWERMYEAVRRMFIEHQEGLGFWKMMVPVASLGIGFGLGYYIFGPGSMPGSPTGGSSNPVSVGALMLLGLTDPRDLLDEHSGAVTWAKRIAAGLVGVAVLAGGLLVFGPAVFAILAGAFIAGFAVYPVLTLILGAVGFGGAKLADLIMMAGFWGFTEPVVDQTEDDQYRVVEAEDIGLENIPKAKFCRTLVGFSCEVTPESFGHAGYSASDVEDFRPSDQLAADGGNEALPRDTIPTDGLVNANHLGFMAADPDPSTTFVRTDNWLGRFKDAATGDTIDTAMQEAVKKYAAGDPEISDGFMLKLSAGLGLIGFGFWVVVALAF